MVPQERALNYVERPVQTSTTEDWS